MGIGLAILIGMRFIGKFKLGYPITYLSVSIQYSLDLFSRNVLRRIRRRWRKRLSYYACGSYMIFMCLDSAPLSRSRRFKLTGESFRLFFGCVLFFSISYY